MKMKLYDARLDPIEIEYQDRSFFQKSKEFDVIQAGIPEEEYITLDDLQEEFTISRYQVDGYLKRIGATHFGIRKNVVDGKRIRGVGKKVYKVEVIEQIRNLINEEEIEEIKELAARWLSGELK